MYGISNISPVWINRTLYLIVQQVSTQTKNDFLDEITG